MPQMGVSVAEGTIVEWRVSEGDSIAADETLCEISTDKIDTEVPAPVSGVVTEILVPVETTVSVGTVLARIATGAAPGSAPEPVGCRSGGAAEAGRPLQEKLRKRDAHRLALFPHWNASLMNLIGREPRLSIISNPSLDKTHGPACCSRRCS